MNDEALRAMAAGDRRRAALEHVRYALAVEVMFDECDARLEALREFYRIMEK